jgi:ATP-dependent Lhr-like helicase
MSNQLDQRVYSAFYGRFPKLRDAQEATIEPLLSGRNVILTAGTGSGKTEAVMAPLVSKYWRQAVSSNALFLLYIAPTKALVNDLEKRLHPPLASIGLRIAVRHGDKDDLAGGALAHVLITTPESLDVLLFRGEPALRSIKAVVIDEVHLVYNTQRGLQLSILLRRLRQILASRLQWVALSATIGNLSHIRDFLVGSDEGADLLAFSSQREIDAQIRHVRSMADFLSVVRRMTDRRSTKLLVFANSRRECEHLTSALKQNESLRNFVFTHYSSLSPEVRVDTEHKFSSMDTAICVATSTLELGIDIGDIDAVLLWGAPANVDSFLQRIGRGNRRSNKTNVLCFVPDDSSSVIIDALRFAALIDAASKGELPEREPYDLFGAVGQQCLSIIASNSGQFTKISDLCELLNHKPYLSRDTVETILAELSAKGFLQRHGYKNRYGADEELYRLVDMRLIYGNFAVGSQMVNVFHGAKCLGEIPAINLLRVRGDTCVRFAGKCWRVNKVSRDGIHLQPSRPDAETIDFSYGGNSASIDPHNINHIWQMIHSDELSLNLFTTELQQQIGIFRDRFRRMCSQNQMPYLRSSEGICYFTFAGYLVNRAVGLYERKHDFRADDLSLFVPSPIDWASIGIHPSDYESFFHLLFEDSVEQSIYQKQLPPDLQEQEYLQDWIKDTIITRILARLVEAGTRLIDKEIAINFGFYA